MSVDSPVNVLSVCAGAAGLDRGLRMALPSTRTVCYVEIEAYAVEVLAEAMEESRLDSAPIWTDLRSFDGKPWRGAVDCLCGGYPCQPFSVAGLLLGRKDPRHLWPVIAKLVGDIEPSFVFFENVPGHVKRGLREVRSDLQRMGYCVAAGLFRAEEVGAPHRRERLFILGVASASRLALGARWRRDILEKFAPVERASGSLADAAVLGRLRGEGVRREAGNRPQHGGGGELADADGQRIADAYVQGPAIGGGRAGARALVAGRSDTPLADAEHPRLRRGGAPHDNDGRDAPRNHAHRCDAELVPAEAVSDAEGDAIRVEPERDQRQGRRVRAPIGGNAELGHDGTPWPSPFPPAPDDEIGWRRLLAVEPRVEPAVRRDAHGLAVGPHGSGVPARFCLCNRVDRLRLCGNGAIPDQVAYAFATLAQEFI